MSEVEESDAGFLLIKKNPSLKNEDIWKCWILIISVCQNEKQK